MHSVESLRLVLEGCSWQNPLWQACNTVPHFQKHLSATGYFLQHHGSQPHDMQVIRMMEERIIVPTKPLSRARSLTLPEMGPSRSHLRKMMMLMLSPYPVSCWAHHDAQQQHMLCSWSSTAPLQESLQHDILALVADFNPLMDKASTMCCLPSRLSGLHQLSHYCLKQSWCNDLSFGAQLDRNQHDR